MDLAEIPNPQVIPSDQALKPAPQEESLRTLITQFAALILLIWL